MKKILISALLGWLAPLCLFAVAPSDTTYHQRMGFVFENVDPGITSTGYLYDYGVHFLNLATYSGESYSDSTRINYSIWQELYNSAFSMHFDPLRGNLPAPELTYEQVVRQRREWAGQKVIPISSLLFTYDRIKKSAVDLGSVTSINGQLQYVDAADLRVHYALAVTPVKNIIHTYEPSFVFPDSLHFTNTGLQVTRIEADFGDGSRLNIALLICQLWQSTMISARKS